MTDPAAYLLVLPELSGTDPQKWWVVKEWLIPVGQRVTAKDEVAKLQGDGGAGSVRAASDGYLYSMHLRAGEGGPPGTVIGLLTNWPNRPPGWRARYGP